MGYEVRSIGTINLLVVVKRALDQTLGQDDCLIVTYYLHKSSYGGSYNLTSYWSCSLPSHNQVRDKQQQRKGWGKRLLLLLTNIVKHKNRAKWLESQVVATQL